MPDNDKKWQTQSLRVTVFPNKPFSLPEPSWWLNLTGELPETRNTSPKLGGQLEEGAFKGGQLSLTVSPLKIDWVYKIQDDQLVEKKELPSLGEFDVALANFLPLINRWLLEMCPTIERLAFGATLFQPVYDREKGYERLSTFLPVVRLDPKSSDFMYQINRPREPKTRIEGLKKINRLCKWSVLGIQLHYLMSIGKVHIEDTGIHATRVEMDINTDKDFHNDLPADRLPDLLKEFVDLAKEISIRGDIP